jgi:hypothetical protein
LPPLGSPEDFEAVEKKPLRKSTAEYLDKVGTGNFAVAR